MTTDTETTDRDPVEEGVQRAVALVRALRREVEETRSAGDRYAYALVGALEDTLAAVESRLDAETMGDV